MSFDDDIREPSALVGWAQLCEGCGHALRRHFKTTPGGPEGCSGCECTGFRNMFGGPEEAKEAREFLRKGLVQ